jgi:signal transduction histidine kinase
MKKWTDQFNFEKAAKELGVKYWQTPNFLFLAMGVVISFTMIVLFLITKSYSDPRILIISESFVAVVMLTVGSSIISRFSSLAKINRLKTRFIELASNRLKDPLAAIRWELEVLLERTDGNLNARQKARVFSVIDLNESMTNLVKDLLDAVEFEDFDKEKDQTIIEPAGLISSVIFDCKNYAKSREIKLNFEEEPLQNRFLRGNRKLLKIALENIILNAIRFSKKRGRVDIGLKREKDFVIFSVKDRGAGIPVGEQEFIFGKFFRASNILSHSKKGSGLGLYVARRIIETFSGKIWFESREGHGSTFFIKLPCFLIQ